MSESLFSTQELAKVYEQGQFHALRGVDVRIGEGEMVAITGASGSGKSTLLHLLGGLDRPSSGRIFFRGQALDSIDLDRYRARDIGFIFQSFHLLDTLTALENVQIPLFEGELPRASWARHAMDLLELVGMSAHAGKRPTQMSGGERQRVAIARSLANRPSVLLADEPTGNLDSANTQKIMELLTRIHDERKMAVIVVTHDPSVSAYAARVIRLQDGLILDDRRTRP